GSPQIIELAMVVCAFRRWPTDLNIVTDSAYVAGLVSRMESAFLKEAANPQLFTLMRELLFLLNWWLGKYFIMHVRSHINLPGPIAKGNAQADVVAGPVVVPNTFEQACLSHESFHQNAKALACQFSISKEQAQAIVASCPDCQQVMPAVPSGINPQGLSALELWQTDVTHVPDFSRLKYVHVSVDTFSACNFASCHTGKRARDVVRYLTAAFAALGVPRRVKTNNGPGYTAHQTAHFFQAWGVSHVKGIPHSPTGQAIVEQAHGMLKAMLQKQ
ncbi:hypothetical protein N301_01662, partial [Charadrius vociferus]